VQRGDLLGVRGPYGTAWPVVRAAGRDTLVVAGGLGLAPLRMAIDALSGGLPSRLTVVVGARHPEQLLYADDLNRWAELGVRVHSTVDAADRTWSGSVGTATALLQRLGGPHDVAFICGPELMMTSAVRAAVAHGTSSERVWVSLERNMHCGIAHCGRCQLGPLLLCREGAVVRWDRVEELLEVRGR
jgi:NAD(P)H-flavin reductase